MKQEIQFGYCQCGCGQKTQVAERNRIRNGVLVATKGEPRKYCRGHSQIGKVRIASDPNNKICTDCLSEKPRAEFYKNKAAYDGIQAWCKSCNTDKQTRYRRNNRDQVNKKHAHYVRQQRLGMSAEHYNRLMEEQDEVCAICKQPERSVTPNGNPRALAADHCHATGAIRGLLCNRCNRAIGMFEDCPNTLVDAANYLKHHVALQKG